MSNFLCGYEYDYTYMYGMLAGDGSGGDRMRIRFSGLRFSNARTSTALEINKIYTGGHSLNILTDKYIKGNIRSAHNKAVLKIEL